MVFCAGRKGCIATIIISVSLSFLLLFVNKEAFNDIEIAILRIPIYFIGMYCAEKANDNKPISLFEWALFVMAVPAKLVAGLLDFPLSRLFNAGYALFLVVIYLIVRKKILAREGLAGFLIKTGELSLELYIVHVAIRNIMGALGIRTAEPLMYCLCIVLAVPIAIGFSKLQVMLLEK